MWTAEAARFPDIKKEPFNLPKLGKRHKQHGERDCVVMDNPSPWSLWAFTCAPSLPPDYSSVSRTWPRAGHSPWPRDNFSLSAPGFAAWLQTRRMLTLLLRVIPVEFDSPLERKELQPCSESSGMKPARLCSHSWLFPTHPNTCHENTFVLSLCD